MSKAGRINSINPPYAIPGGEISIECEGFEINQSDEYGVFFDGQKARLVGASSKRILAVVPEDFEATDVSVQLENAGEKSEPFKIVVGQNWLKICTSSPIRQSTRRTIRSS
jgi:uncharacterized protein (TIGR03437 family)